MRRFISSLTGKVVSHVVCVALLMPTLTLGLLSRAPAQVAAARDQLGVVEFTNLKAPGTDFGKRAQADVTGEFAKVGDPNTEIVSQETIQRVITQLGVDSPPSQLTNLLRVGQEARVTKIVTGDIVDYRVVNVDGGKQAQLSMRVVVYDVASGLPVNGSAVKGESTIRPSSTDDATLINDAIRQASSVAVREISSQKLPRATVLNTLTNRASINQGARSGFKDGQVVIVKRGREQVATAKVVDVQPDSATIVVERSTKGIRPGDTAEAIFTVPSLLPGFTAAGEPNVKRSRPSGNSSGLVSALLVLGLLAVLLGGGNSGGNNPAANVTAEAYMDPTIGLNDAAIRIRWTVNAFSNGRDKVAWQVWRSDVSDAPVAVVDGTASSYITRSSDTGTFAWTSGQSGGSVRCITDIGANEGLVRPIVAGVPYQFAVELVQAVDSLNDPNQGGSGTNNTGTNNTGTNNTGTNNTGTNNTGTNNTGTNNTGTNNTGTTAGTTAGTTSTIVCYTISDRQNANGLATGLIRPTLSSPADNAQLTGNQTFTFVVNGSPLFATSLEAVLELSSTRDFRQGTIFTVARKQSRNGVDTFPSVDVNGSNIPGFIRSATEVYWRVGVRNTADRPGPRPERNGWGNYVYSTVRAYRPPVGPPPPP